MTITYHCSGFKPIVRGGEYPVGERYKFDVYDVKDAAFVFATRWAKRHFGSRGFCHHVRQDCHTPDGTAFNFEAFVGVPWERTGCSGHNEFFYVYIKGEDDDEHQG